jgi:hypothetical protein
MFKNTYLYVMDADGSNETNLTLELDRPAGSIKWGNDNKHIYF